MIKDVKRVKRFVLDPVYLDPYQQLLLHNAVEKSFKPVGRFTYSAPASERVEVWEETLTEILDEFSDVPVDYVQ